MGWKVGIVDVDVECRYENTWFVLLKHKLELLSTIFDK